MKLGYALRHLHLVERNKAWLRAPLPLSARLGYYPSMTRALVSKRGTVRFLGRDFAYDNVATPLNLQTYPDDVGNRIGGRLTHPPRTVLDIGGNIGQFSITANYFWPEAQIDVFEPNPTAFAVLEANLAALDRITAFRMGVGDGRTHVLHFEPNRSATASFDPSNVLELTERREVNVPTTAHPETVTGRGWYDLVKIDVEGYELEVIRNLRGISTTHLFLEGSSGRSRNYHHNELWESIRTTFGAFDIEYLTPIRHDSPTFEMLLRFVEATRPDGD